MIRLAVVNQRGGVGKTSTTANLASHYASLGRRVLCIDADSQGSLSDAFGVRGERVLYDFLITQLAFDQCVVQARPNIDLLSSNRSTMKAEAILMGATARERTFEEAFQAVDHIYDVVLVDTGPTITLMQTCSLLYTRNFLMPVAMDWLALQGAVATLESARFLGSRYKEEIRAVALLPTNVDPRLQMSKTIMRGLEDLSARTGIELLRPVRADVNVNKSLAYGKVLAEFAADTRALEDYRSAASQILELFEVRHGANTIQTT